MNRLSSREISELFHLIFENSSDAILLGEPGGKIYSVNPSGCRIFQRSEEEIFRSERVELVDKNDPILDFALAERARLGKFQCELKQVRKDGTIFPAEITSIIFKDSEGKERTCTIIRDISKRRLAEEELERFFNLVPDMVCIASTDGYFKKINAEWENLLGYSKDEILATPFIELVHPDDRKATLDEINSKFAGEKTIYFKNRYRCKNGSYLWFEWRATPSINGLLYAVARDITERKNNEIALQESEAKYRSLFENSLMGISATSSSGRLIHANMAYAKMYGYDSPEIMMKEVTNIEKQLFARADDRMEVLRNLREKGFIEPAEYELVRKDGSKFFVLVSACKVRDTDGKFLYNQASHIDLSEQHAIKKELRESKDMLETLHKHLTEIRENERAEISREIHDLLGQSLTAFKMDLSWLPGHLGKDSPALEKVEKMIDQIADIQNDIQRISMELRPGMIDELGLSDTIEWYCDEFMKRTGIKVDMDIEDIQAVNMLKNISLYRILQESLTNIIRHSKATKVSVKLRKTNHNINLLIVDNGIGIPQHKINSPVSIGLIGMTERVKQSNGTIKISSLHNKGTEVRISIPINN